MRRIKYIEPSTFFWNENREERNHEANLERSSCMFLKICRKYKNGRFINPIDVVIN